MTRVLSELLGAEQPRFGMTIRQLEAATGRPSTDIRLTSEVSQRASQKMRLLGLDPNDTTGKELYYSLLERFNHDERLARDVFKLTDSSNSTEVNAATIKFVKAEINKKRNVFALKNSVAKRLLKKVPPKKAMKQLGYRSLDSMLKHEAVPHLYAAAFLCETLAWRKKYLDQYTNLRPSDFELRPAEISMASATRWKNITSKITGRQPVVAFKELGAVVVLGDIRQTTIIGGVTLVTSALNDIQSATSFLKLQQMKPDFGEFVRTIANGEPLTKAELMGRAVPWRVVHQYYARFKDAYNALIFEPHIHSDDLRWTHPESVLSKLHPAIEFWHDTRYTAYLDGGNKISLNVFDVARNYASRLSYAQRVFQGLQQALWQELMIRYLDQKNVEQAIAGDLATEPVFAELEDI